MEARVRWLILCAALLLGTYLRLQDLGELALFGDENHSLRQASEPLGVLLTQFDTLGSHVVLPLVQHFSMQVFGPGLWALRLVALLPGLLTLYLIYPLGKSLVGRTPALLASLALALSPMHIYYSQFARSYALSALLGMLLVFFLARALEAKPEARRDWILSFVIAGLLPYVHLSSAGFVGLAALVSIGCAWKRAGKLQAALWPLFGFGLALALCLAAYAPVWDQVQFYLNEAMPESQKKHPSGLAGIVILLAGGSVQALLMLVMLPLGLLGLARKRTAAALLIAATIAGPVLALLITRPHGMEYAYARYLLTALPFLPMLMAWLLYALAKRLVQSEGTASLACLLLGVLGIGLGFFQGPAWGPRPASPVFNNSYLALHALPAFDAPWSGAPDFYAQLALDPSVERIVEYPPLQTRAVLYYRQLALQHGKQVLLGWPKQPLPGMGPSVYVSMDSVSARDADYIILHRDPAAEVRAYWKFVYAQAGPEEGWGLETGFLKRHRSHWADQQVLNRVDFLANEAAQLRERLGPALYKDSKLLVWKLAP